MSEKDLVLHGRGLYFFVLAVGLQEGFEQTSDVIDPEAHSSQVPWREGSTQVGTERMQPGWGL